MNIALFVLMALSTTGFARSEKTNTEAEQQLVTQIFEEYSSLRKVVEKLPAEPADGDYYYNIIDFPEYSLLWRLENQTSNPSIRLYFPRPELQEAFSVTYHDSQEILPGRRVLRRVIGQERASRWRADTIDFVTGEYLGRQGTLEPHPSEAEKLILDRYGIRYEHTND